MWPTVKSWATPMKRKGQWHHQTGLQTLIRADVKMHVFLFFFLNKMQQSLQRPENYEMQDFWKGRVWHLWHSDFIIVYISLYIISSQESWYVRIRGFINRTFTDILHRPEQQPLYCFHFHCFVHFWTIQFNSVQFDLVKILSISTQDISRHIWETQNPEHEPWAHGELISGKKTKINSLLGNLAGVCLFLSWLI